MCRNRGEFPCSWQLRVFRLGPRVAIHLRRPLQEALQVGALAPHESPKFQEADLAHLEAAVGLDAPLQIRTAPGSEAVAASGAPEKAQDVFHLLFTSILACPKYPE